MSNKLEIALKAHGYVSCLDYANAHPTDSPYTLLRRLGAPREVEAFLDHLQREAAERGTTDHLIRSLFIRLFLDCPLYDLGCQCMALCFETALVDLGHYIPAYHDACMRVVAGFHASKFPDRWAPMSADDAGLIKLFQRYWPPPPEPPSPPRDSHGEVSQP